MSRERFASAKTPPAVTEVLRRGHRYSIGLVEPGKVLKYWPRHDEETEPERQASNDARYCLDIESQILEGMGIHPNIIGYFGIDENGIYLEYAMNGSILDYLESSNPSLKQRLKWSRQAAAALVHCHRHRVIHCGLHPKNLLLDANLDVKLSNFRGRVLNPDGTVFLDGENCEHLKFRSHQEAPDTANEKTDLFALGTTIYWVITDHEPLPELKEDEAAEEIASRWLNQDFPYLQPALGGTVVQKCWRGLYETANQVEEDLDKLLDG